MLSDKREDRLIKGISFWQYRAEALGYFPEFKKSYLITLRFPEGYEKTVELKLADLKDNQEEQQFLDWVFIHVKKNNYLLAAIEKFFNGEELEEIKLRLWNKK